MVSSYPLNPESFNPFTNLLVTFTCAPITIGVTVTFMFHSFSFLSQGLCTYLAFHSLSVLLYGQPKRQNLHFGRFSFLVVDFHLAWTSGRDWVINLYIKLPEKCVRLIRQDGFWAVYIPFVLMVKFKLLAQFPVYHLPHPVVCSLLLFLHLYSIPMIRICETYIECS